jgi:hypothetical protein
MSRTLVNTDDLRLILSNVKSCNNAIDNLKLMEAISRIKFNVGTRERSYTIALLLSSNSRNLPTTISAKITMIKLIREIFKKSDGSNISLKEAKDFSDTCLDNYKSVVLFKNKNRMSAFKNKFDLTYVQHKFERVTKKETQLHSMFPSSTYLYWEP